MISDCYRKRTRQKAASLTGLLAAILGISSPGLLAQTPLSPSAIRTAAEKAIPLLEQSAAHSLGERACFTCHHGANTILAANEGWRKGLQIDTDNLNQQVTRAYQRLAHNLPRFINGRFETGQGDLLGQSLWVLDVVGRGPDEVTEKAVDFLLDHDPHLDHWAPKESRPPTVGSHFTTTYVVMRGLKRYGMPAQAARIATRTQEVKGWLRKTSSADTEDMVSRLRLLDLLMPHSEAFATERKKLIDDQREDGGWAQTQVHNSDAYATGVALAALVDTQAIETTDPVYQDGLRFLIDTQEEDGSWHVRKRARTIQPFFESRFPHERDQFISIAATSWTVYALLKAIPLKAGTRESSYLSNQTLVLEPANSTVEEYTDEAVAFFNERIQPVLSERCYACHSSEAKKLKANLHLDTRDGLLAGGDNGPAIVPGDPNKSLIIQTLLEQDEWTLMPPKKPLPEDVISDFQIWVRMGAPDPRIQPSGSDTPHPRP